MTQRGRKSAASLIGPKVTTTPPRITAPSSLTIAEQSLFNELTGACDASHFRRSDIPLVVSYVQATRIAQDASRTPETIALCEAVYAAAKEHRVTTVREFLV